jgi:hypothetical protein
MGQILAEADYQVVQNAIGAVTDESYTSARRISSSGVITADNKGIDPDTETYSGQLRWRKPLNHVVNVASAKDATKGSFSTSEAGLANYIKTVRTSGVQKINIADILTQSDGLTKYGLDFAEGRANDENSAILALLHGVMLSEGLRGVAGLGGQSFDNDPASASYGMYIDLGAAKPVIDASAAVQGAARAEGFMNALGMAYKDYEPEYVYLVISTRIMASLRSANMVDGTTVVDGNMSFQTILDGKFRLLVSRSNMGFTAAELTKLNVGAAVPIVGTKASFMIVPGAISFNNLDIPVATEIYRVPGAYKGSGTTEMWSRWGYIAHPYGYSWAGPTDDFVSNAGLESMMQSAAPVTLTAATNIVGATPIWTRQTSDVLTLGIVPVFHS